MHLYRPKIQEGCENTIFSFIWAQKLKDSDFRTTYYCGDERAMQSPENGRIARNVRFGAKKAVNAIVRSIGDFG